MTVTTIDFSGGITSALFSDSLVDSSNYLYSLCGKYTFEAQAIMNGATGGNTVIVNGSQAIISPIKITNLDFANATDWNGTNSYGLVIQSYYTLQILGDSINQRMLVQGTQWVRTTTGFRILLDGFDATINEYILYVYISI